MFQFLILAITLMAIQSLAIPQKYMDQNMTQRWPQSGVYGATGADLKYAEWKACHQNQSKIFSRGEELSIIESFLEDTHVITTLEEMDKRALLSGKVLVSPWSGDYWPYAAGLIAARYLDSDFLGNFDWLGRYNYINAHPMSSVIQTQGQEGVDKLSIAEKYDLLTGSKEASLTKAMWLAGKKYYDAHGEVEEWMGICHGWAPAAIIEERPVQKVTLKSMEGNWDISLVPSEVKGLLSYSWATNSYRQLSLGSRCQEKDPKRDENGRLIDPACQDMNPGVWHEVVVNMVGRQKRSFVMDATYDYEVWNQPVKEYSYTYFDVNTEKSSANFREVVQKISDFKNDPYSRYRSGGVKYIVGVNMKLAYVSETPASDIPTDSERNDSIVWVEYVYDLELDQNFKIIGGEWRTDGHPDFVWVPQKGSSPKSAYEYATISGAWSASDNQLPQVWAVAARTASAQQGRVIHGIAEEILNRAK